MFGSSPKLLAQFSHCLLALLILAECARAAEFKDESQHYFGGIGLSVRMTGEIVPGDDIKFIALAKTLTLSGKPVMPPQLLLHSNGGDVETAIKIGRFLRDKEWTTGVAYRNACVSSCVFVFAGGVSRIAIQHADEQSGLGVHRFFFYDLSPNASKAEVSRRYKASKQAVTDYLNEMNISQELLTAMESVPPEKVRFLTQEEVERYRLSGDDPEFNERQTGKQAYMHGTTSAEFRRRSAQANVSCKSPWTLEMIEKGRVLDSAAASQYSDCLNSILYGIGIAELNKRTTIWMQEVERKNLKNKSQEEISRCYRAIMAEGKPSC